MLATTDQPLSHNASPVTPINYWWLGMHIPYFVYTLSGRIGKVVASHVAVPRSSPAEVALIYTMHESLREYWV